MSQPVTFTVEMDELKRAVNFARNALGNVKTDLAALLFRFEVKGNKASIFAADKEMFTRTELNIRRPDGDPDGVFAVLGEKMESLVAQIAAEKVEFTVDQESLEARAGFLTVNFETYDSTPLRSVELGVFEHLNLGTDTPVLREILTEGLACAKACSTTDSLKPNINHSELRNGRLLASDGRKVMIFTPDGFEKKVFLKVPNSVLSAVVTCLKNIDSESVLVLEGKSYFYIKTANNKFSLGVRKVERSFPEIEDQMTRNVIPDDEVSVDKNVFVQMCKGVSLGLSGDEVRVEVSLRGEGREAVLEIEGSNRLSRRSHETTSCGRKSTEAIVFPISFKHILDTLSVFKGDSVVDMVVAAKRNILLVRDRTTNREVLTVIPFRTSKQIEEEKKEAEKKEAAKKPEVKPTSDKADPALVDAAVAPSLE